MDVSDERLIVRAGTVDELLSDDFEILPGQKGDADLAARRLAAWCRACSSGDWALFSRRLKRDGLQIDQVLAKFATVRRRPSAAIPVWVHDAKWIEAALCHPAPLAAQAHRQSQPHPFEHLFASVIEKAEVLLWTGIEQRVATHLSESALSCLRDSLREQLCSVSAPALYERFVRAKPQPSETQPAHGSTRYDSFIEQMRSVGLRQLFDEKPVLLRLIASLTRQWIETWREFVVRLDADLTRMRKVVLDSDVYSKVIKIEGELSDPHNHGHSVQIVEFGDGGRAVYKPKDLRLDAAWFALIARLNESDAPVELRAVKALVRDGYGWTAFVGHAECADHNGISRFFRRAGAWLALFHCFAATDMHQENMIASGDHPVPIDLEMILQAAAKPTIGDAEGEAQEAAIEAIANSVSMIGMLPAFGRSPDNDIFAVGGMNSESNSRTKRGWADINTDAMRPQAWKEIDNSAPNLPHLDGKPAKFGDHIDAFVAGFEDYSRFLLRQRDSKGHDLLEGFAGLPVRRVLRPTRFYYMLLQRLRDHRSMDDGAGWAAQMDFIARLGDWETDRDPNWPLHRAERLALAELNVPHFLSASDGHKTYDATGISTHTSATSGLDRARARIRDFDNQAIAWQAEIIRQSTLSVSGSAGPVGAAPLRRQLWVDAPVVPPREVFVVEADRVAKELSQRAIRRGPGAAWIGYEWLGDSEVSQLVPLGVDLYSGVCGIAVFLAAHASVTGSEASYTLALAAVADLRKRLKRRAAARMARSIGIGGATGLGSIVYTLSVMARCLRSDELLADAHIAAELVTDDLIAADKQLDVMSGSAGAILGLLRLYRDSGSKEALNLAAKCGDHLLGQRRVGPRGSRSFSMPGPHPHGFNGMAHGAAGFAFALASLAAATRREEFASAAAECITFENSSYDAERNNWPDLRSGAAAVWRCQWCHGAPGVGLARISTRRQGGIEPGLLETDIRKALKGADRNWPHPIDTLCCGTLGSIEFICEAGDALGQPELQDLAARRMMSVMQTALSTGDYRWNAGKREFNLGLFRGIAGVGYTLLRRVDATLPNILIWE